MSFVRGRTSPASTGLSGLMSKGRSGLVLTGRGGLASTCRTGSVLTGQGGLVLTGLGRLEAVWVGPRRRNAVVMGRVTAGLSLTWLVGLLRRALGLLPQSLSRPPKKLGLRPGAPSGTGVRCGLCGRV